MTKEQLERAKQLDNEIAHIKHKLELLKWMSNLKMVVRNKATCDIIYKDNDHLITVDKDMREAIENHLYDKLRKKVKELESL